MKKLVIFGIGKIGQVVLHHFATDSDYSIAGFAVDKAYIPQGGMFEGLPVVAFDEMEKHFPSQSHDLFVAVGYQQMNRLRAVRCEEARKKGYTLPNYISSANKHIKSPMGDNNFIMSGEPLQPRTKIGSGCFIWTNAIIGHHTQMGDYCWVTSNVTIGGNCRVGDNCFLGLGATIGHEISIGAHSLIGAGALITRDAPEGSVYIAPETPRFRLTSEQFLKMNTLK
ncbi:MAG: NeuD/PglB/VioB family sugar acetyltransferase [Alphaproteobacteria bacterium]